MAVRMMARPLSFTRTATRHIFRRRRRLFASESRPGYVAEAPATAKAGGGWRSWPWRKLGAAAVAGCAAGQVLFGATDDYYEYRFITTKDPDDLATFYGSEARIIYHGGTILCPLPDHSMRLTRNVAPRPRTSWKSSA